MDIEIKFDYGVDFKKIKSIVLTAIASFDQCLKDPPPRVGLQKFEADGYTMVIADIAEQKLTVSRTHYFFPGALVKGH